MALYLAKRILGGFLDYEAVFAIPTYKQFQDEVDKKLREEGREDLIVK